jgi:hypothetical protein
LQEKEFPSQCEPQISESSTNSDSSVRERSGKASRDSNKQQNTDGISDECGGSVDKSDRKSETQEFPPANVTVKKEIPEEEGQAEVDGSGAGGNSNFRDKGIHQKFMPVRRRSSLNPVNLSMSNPDENSDSPRSPGHLRSADADAGEDRELAADTSDRDIVTKVGYKQVICENIIPTIALFSEPSNVFSTYPFQI